MRLTLLVLYCLLGISTGVAQELDTLKLNEIAVYGSPISKYSSGAKVLKLRSDQNSTLNQQIGDQLPVYFKTYGNGQLSTVAFRGTSASHTAVLWNGIPVNSPTLGQTDFSLWPSFLLDDIAVQFGSSASLYGSGAIGGSIFLESSKPDLDDKVDITLLSQVGSFGQFTNGISASYGRKNVVAKTKLYHHYIENDFSFPLKGRDEIRTQNHAAVKQMGISQDVFYDMRNHKIAFHGLLLHNDREIQPSIATPNSSDQLEDANLRLALSHDVALRKGEWNNTLSYIINDQYFNVDSRVVSQQFSGITNYEIPLGNSGSLRVGANINHFVAETENYFTTDWLTDLFSALTFEPLPSWKLSINLRQSLDNVAKPFAPSVGSEITILKSSKTELIWTAQASRAYRLPTLNDRFWQPGGNPDLQAEESISVETGYNLKINSDKLDFRLGLNGFRSWVDQWIIWLPNDQQIWSPNNIMEVSVTGIELNSSMAHSFVRGSIRLNANYAFTESINQSGLSANDNSEGKQLPYVPKHQFTIALSGNYSSWNFNVNNNFTGVRFTTDDNREANKVDAFNLVNIRIGKEVEINNLLFNLSIESRNVTDIYFENLINRAMPGRSYIFSLMLNI